MIQLTSSLFFRSVKKKLSTLSSQSQRDGDGRTSLHLAALLGDKKIYSQDGAIEIDRYGLTPSDIARYLGTQADARFSPLLPIRQKDGTLVRRDDHKIFCFSYRKSLRFQNGYILDWALRASERKLRQPSMKQENDWAKALFSDGFLHQKRPSIELRYIDAIVGYGIFASDNIPELSFIGEYTGLVRPRDRKGDRLNPYIFSYVVGTSGTSFVIDAKDEGNYARFINHSGFPNCTSRWMIAEGVCHIVLFANQFIKKGTQLTYDYGPSYWRNRIHPIDF